MSPGGPGPSTAGPLSPPRLRRKRAQVVRACDWCRKQRIKCDNDQPCLNCKNRGGECSNEVIRAATLPHSYREIDRLRRQVRDLERQLEQERARPTTTTHHCLPSPPNPSSSTPGSLPDTRIADENRQQSFWQGVRIHSARSPHETWYGPSSFYAFLGRLADFLNSTFPQTDPAQQIPRPISSSILFDEGNGSSENTSCRLQAPTPGCPKAKPSYLSPTQEEYFLDLFWQSYHTCLFPIINETEFKKHYQSLWTASTAGHGRKPSALVDIVLALCMQRGISMLPPTGRQTSAPGFDDSIAGRQYFQRYQRLIQYEMESPTMSTLQSHILCCVYFCNATFMNMADEECALAVRMAYMLDLHREPSPTLPRHERELRKHIWWSLYIVDTKVAVKLGRPSHITDTGPSLPSDGRDAAMESGSYFAAPGDDSTWLSFSLHQIKLLIAAREAHTAFYGNPLDIREGETIWDNPCALEAHAKFMQPYANALEDWTKGVPRTLTTKRQGNGQPFSTEDSALEIEQFAPLWLQRQRLLLELVYHNLSIYQWRPFITFASPPASTPAEPSLARQIAVKAASHAIILTKISHQVISSTSILTGWDEVFQWQWNASVSLVGFVAAYPHDPSTPAARSAIDLSVAVFELFSKSGTVPDGAADIVRKLCAKVDFLAQVAQGPTGALDDGGGWPAGSTPGHSVAPDGLGDSLLAGSSIPGAGTTPEALNFNLDDVTASSIQDMFQMAVAVDQWGGLDMLWPPVDMWPEESPVAPSGA
ncbi:related to transcriptional activator Mut3p [Cephalotrichum gorgonifer]|uniref:Related to transcriptional activator Mut3p n=1 Tax=Cephalotrichum gorgonifer TaxID=2041049 RepID=A0AAE8MYM8_9PEZI|nr:related to transcriptional activator Mut3p [Cephalotrichum gorgonifer]